MNGGDSFLERLSIKGRARKWSYLFLSIQSSNHQLTDQLAIEHYNERQK